jgi:hypothetical protein
VPITGTIGSRAPRPLRTAARRAAVTLGVAATALVVAAAPALAATSATSDHGLSVIETLLLFVAAPAVIFGGIVLLVVGPSMARAGHEGPRGRSTPRLPILEHEDDADRS